MPVSANDIKTTGSPDVYRTVNFPDNPQRFQ
jgi:hypothetical protein